MRKISSILTLLLLCLCGNLSAQTRLTNIADGVYYLVCPANSGHAYYDGTNQYLRRTDSPQENGKFTITQGTGEYVGYYTIQTNDGKYVVAGTSLSHSTEAGVNVKVVESAEATDENKWWVITVDGSNASYVDIFPKQPTLTTTTAAWNFASNYGTEANKVVGLWNASGGESNWILVSTKRVISMNFGNQGSALYSDGINKVPAAAWNNVTAAGNTRGDLKTWDGTAAATLSPNWSVTWSSKETWYYTTVTENILKGYLDDGAQANGKYATVTFTNLPFTTGYDLYIYSATDTENANFRPVSVTMNGHTYTYTTESGVGYFGTSNWGQSRNATSVMGTNVICIKGLTASEITISGGDKSGSARGGIAAVQIVETGASNVINVEGDTYDVSGVTSPIYLIKDGDLSLENASPELIAKYIDVTGVTGNVTLAGYVDINYTLTDPNGATYSGVYNTYWDNDATACPPMNGVTFNNKVFTNTGTGYTLTADISFPFPVCTNSVEKNTGIQSNLGSSMWFAKTDETGDYVCATNAQNTTFGYRTQDNFKWYIYPSFANGQFSFKIKHNSGKYIPSFTGSQGSNTKNYLVDEASAGTFFYMPCTLDKLGFSINAEGAIFLTVNTSGTDQPIWSWAKSGNASHEGSNLTFPKAEITLDDLKTQLATYQSIEKFDILSGTIVQGPDEFDNPTEINAAIDAANNVDTDNEEAILSYLEGTECTKLKRYQNQLTSIGKPLANVQFLMKGQYGTLILPCPSSIPTGLRVYSCSTLEEDGSTLVLTPATTRIEAKTPYIIESTEVGYTIVGWSYLTATDGSTKNVGLLTGVFDAAGASVPTGGYVLARNKTTRKQGFFRTDGSVICPQYKCYLTVPSSATAAKELYFDNEGTTTGIEAIFGGENNEVVIYDLSGKRLNRLQKGVNIVNGHKVLVK